MIPLCRTTGTRTKNSRRQQVVAEEVARPSFNKKTGCKRRRPTPQVREEKTSHDIVQKEKTPYAIAQKENSSNDVQKTRSPTTRKKRRRPTLITPPGPCATLFCFIPVHECSVVYHFAFENCVLGLSSFIRSERLGFDFAFFQGF